MQNFLRIQRIIHDVTGIPTENIKPESTIDQLDISKLDMTEIMLEIEEAMDILVEEEDDQIKSVDELVQYVEKQMSVA